MRCPSGADKAAFKRARLSRHRKLGERRLACRAVQLQAARPRRAPHHAHWAGHSLLPPAPAECYVLLLAAARQPACPRRLSAVAEQALGSGDWSSPQRDAHHLCYMLANEKQLRRAIWDSNWEIERSMLGAGRQTPGVFRRAPSTLNSRSDRFGKLFK